MLKELKLKAIEINKKGEFSVQIYELTNSVEFVISSKHLEIDTTVGHDYMNNPTYKDNLRVASNDINEPYYNSPVDLAVIQLKNELADICKLQRDLLDILTRKEAK